MGAGIIGLAHAWALARAGLSVTVFERDPRAVGASVRNFGMVWPTGQPNGARWQMAVRSSMLWKEVGEAAGIRIEPCGSIHAAHHEDEFQVLEEYARSANGGYTVLPADAARDFLERVPAPVRRDGLRGLLWSPFECAVDPREAIPGIARHLASEVGVDLQFGRCVIGVEDGIVRLAGGGVHEAGRVLIASGHEMRILFPEELAAAGLVTCKLHMMKTVAQPASLAWGPHVASGLTLRHYESFAASPSLAKLRERIASKSPELDQFGIHVMAARNGAGEIVIGDSHEYGDGATPFNRSRIDALILAELQKILELPTWEIAERWTGCYAKHPERPFVEIDVPGGKIVTGFGGAGMTMSFGAAEDVVGRWLA